MKVLQLGPYPPPNGGVQTHIAALVDFLRQSGVTCDVMNLTRFRRPSGDGIFYPSNSLEVLAHLVSHRYDIIHLHIGGRIFLRQLGLAIACSGLPKSHSVLTFHSGGYPSSEEGRSAHPRTLRAFALRRFDRIIAVNAEIAAFFERLGVRPDRVRLISPHAPPARVGTPAGLPPAVEKFFGDHQPLLITVGLLEPEYDLALQIEAMKFVREKWPKAGLLIAGSGSLHEALGQHIEQQPYAEHVLLYGDLPHAATLEAITRADLMLRATWYDGDALSVREALHFGLPVIATDNGMRPAGVRLIPPRDLKKLLAAIDDALAKPATNGESPAPPDNSNLTAVLDLYRELKA
ncbi:MAG TPA: glycosyltransferase family 4 protein [Terriglobales bacterium]|jgi:glycosyltransferase involved in cell wall biosynthesis|nr:glycosyltransferase family 4 protein [Terriglobales bacterium]